MIKLKLESLMAKNNLTKVGLAEGTGLSDQTIANVLKGADIKVSSLKKIADYFNIPIGYFFGEISIEQNMNGNSNVVIGRDNLGSISMVECQAKLDEAQKEISHLKEVIEGKDKLLEEKERLINVLMNR